MEYFKRTHRQQASARSHTTLNQQAFLDDRNRVPQSFFRTVKTIIQGSELVSNSLQLEAAIEIPTFLEGIS